MTQQEILKYNKRCMKILEMEYEIHSNTYRYKDLITTTLQFHSDWNWIHEVIEAIIETYNKSHYITSKINYSLSKNCLNKNYRCEISIDDRFMKNVTIYTENLDKKEAVVQAINQFLIWYNENKTN